VSCHTLDDMTQNRIDSISGCTYSLGFLTICVTSQVTVTVTEGCTYELTLPTLGYMTQLGHSICVILFVTASVAVLIALATLRFVSRHK